MGVPKGKTSKANKRSRRATQKLTAPGTTICPQCHGLKMPHRACTECGYYKGRPVVAKEA